MDQKLEKWETVSNRSCYPATAIRPRRQVPRRQVRRRQVWRGVLLWTLAIVWMAIVWLAPGTAAGQSVVERSREAVRKYERADFEAAERLFAEARRAEPDNRRHAFNHGCALAAQGRLDEALPLFREAANGDRPELAARAQFNVGGVLVAQALQLVGDDPLAADPETRQAAEALCEQAVVAYRQCRELSADDGVDGDEDGDEDAGHADTAGDNLERVRIWLDQTRRAWRQHDRRQRRSDSNLFEFLRVLQDENAQVRRQSATLVDQWPSPRRRQAAFEQADSQRQTADELDHLQRKFREAFAPPAGAGASVPPPRDNRQPAADEPRIRAWVGDRIAQCRAAMQRAALHLEAGEPASAFAAQTAADDELNELFMAVAPFHDLLRRAIGRQEQLVSQGQGARGGQGAGTQSPGSTEDDPLTIVEPARAQQRVTLWSKALREKAVDQLSRLPRQPRGPRRGREAPVLPEEPELLEEPGQPGNSGRVSDAPVGSAPTTPQDDASRKAWEAAVELTPEIEQRSAEAVVDLNRQDSSSALPKQQRALELLRQIASSLPPPPQQDQQKQDQQPRGSPPKSDRDEPSDSSAKERQDDTTKPNEDDSTQPKEPGSDSEPKPDSESKPEQSKPSQEQSKPEETQSSNQQKGEQTGSERGGPTPQRAQEGVQQAEGAQKAARVGKQQAEAALLQARERRQRYSELLRELRARVRGSARVDRDW